MKKIIMMVAPLLLCATAFAQEPVKPYKVYCMFVSQPLSLSDQVEVDIDYGQLASSWTTDRRLYGDNGKTLKFNSVMDAVNFMAKLGWELEEAAQVMKPSGGSLDNPVFSWIMSKMITEDAQITEGLNVGDKKAK